MKLKYTRKVQENFDKNYENCKYLNHVSGNLLQIFESKDITSNLTLIGDKCQILNVRNFMSNYLT